jgi:hypothetical protein
MYDSQHDPVAEARHRRRQRTKRIILAAPVGALAILWVAPWPSLPTRIIILAAATATASIIWALIARRSTDAQRAYFSLADDKADLWDDLRTALGGGRAGILESLAWTYEQLAELHPRAFDPDVDPDDCGTSVSDALAGAARLLRLAVAAEQTLVRGDDVFIFNTKMIDVPADKSAGVLALWVKLATSSDRAERSALYNEIHDVLQEHVSQLAAQVLIILAAAEADAPAPVEREDDHQHLPLAPS